MTMEYDIMINCICGDGHQDIEMEYEHKGKLTKAKPGKVIFDVAWDVMLSKVGGVKILAPETWNWKFTPLERQNQRNKKRLDDFFVGFVTSYVTKYSEEEMKGHGNLVSALAMYFKDDPRALLDNVNILFGFAVQNVGTCMANLLAYIH
jgi:hypothetical protein